MNTCVYKIADAVMYEGYSLYPYRTTALKNQQRWHFGALYPREFCEREDANDAYFMQTECLVIHATAEAQLQVTIRFLQLFPDCVARDTRLTELQLSKLEMVPYEQPFEFPGLLGAVAVHATVENLVHKITVRILNRTSMPAGNREAALRHTLISTHAILQIQGGEFVSAIDPPLPLKQEAAACRNIGLWPVLISDLGINSTILAAPIILEDHPKIAAQSMGDHFDCTEIDEILALRILTLTDAEKIEMRKDKRTRAMLERTEALSSEQHSKLHGIVLELKGSSFKKGARVRLHPNGRADIFDIALNGMTAIIESVEHDFEDRIYVTVTIEADPGRDLGATGQPGHRFFFRPDELELL